MNDCSELWISISKRIDDGFLEITNNINEDVSIYPASIAKILIGAEVLRVVEQGNISLEDKVIAIENDIVDFSLDEFLYDKRPLIKIDDERTIDELLSLMLSRSDNTASNILLRLVTRESINENIVKKHKYFGSEITRKYGPRTLEEEKYKDAPVTTCKPIHYKDIMEKVSNNEFISHFVSMRLKQYLLHKGSEGFFQEFGKDYTFYFKGGGHQSVNGYGQIVRWKHHLSILKRNNEEYIICIFTLLKTLDKENIININTIIKNKLSV